MANLKLVDAFTDFVEESTLPYRQMMTYYNCALMEVETKFKVLNEQFSLFYDRNPIESIHTRIKSQSSILKKLQKKNLALTIPNIENNLFDIAGVRVICSFTEDIYSLANSFLSQDDVRLIEKKDYIQNTFEVDKIGLFGSYAKDMQTENSDIDIYVEFKNKTFKNISGLWVFLEELYNKKIDLMHKHKRSNGAIFDKIQKEVIFS